MIEQLNIRHFVTIDECQLTFEHGLSVLTGETGAGKSIIMEAIEYLLGQRAKPTVVRAGCEKAVISGTFCIAEGTPAYRWLEDQALYDSPVIIRRIITQEGRSKAFINGQPVTLNQLKALGACLINIHSQHAHLHLLDSKIQRRIIDGFIEDTSSLKNVKIAFEQWRTLLQTLNESTSTRETHAARCDLLSYQLKELDDLALQEGEYSALFEDYKRYQHAYDVIEQCHIASRLIKEDEDTNARIYIQKAITALNSIRQYDARLNNAIDLLERADVFLDEAGDAIHTVSEASDLDEETLSSLEKRLEHIHQLARKHKVSPEALFDHHQTLAEEYHRLQYSSESLEALQKQCKTLEVAFFTAATKLSGTRVRIADSFAKSITPLLKELGMPHAQFNVQVDTLSSEYAQPHGIDRVIFLVKTNPEQGFLPLSEVASGGELSRICLAIEAIRNQSSGHAMAVFDEVDVGIGGQTAETVGQLLKKLAEQQQVLCITHLPQVAAQGDHHYEVTKSVKHGKTYTELAKLDHLARIKEIARMLGGKTISEHIEAHAKTLVEAG